MRVRSPLDAPNNYCTRDIIMSIALTSMTKNSKWKTTAEVPFYPIKPCRWRVDVDNTTSDAPVGTELTVPPKRATDTFNDSTWNSELRKWEKTWEKSGVFFHVEVNGIRGIVFHSDIKDCIELLEQPKDVAYYIRDASTERLYVCEVFHAGDVKKNETITTHEVGPAKYQCRDHVDIRWAVTPGSAKKFKDIGQIKNRILQITGYYNGMGSDMETWYPLKVIPEQWEAVEYDKVSKTFTVLDIDLNAYHKEAFRLRDFTRKFGSACRDMYKKLESKDTLKDFPYFVLFNVGDVNQHSNGELMAAGYTNPLLVSTETKQFDGALGADYKINDEQVALIKKVAYKDLKKSIKTDSACFALADECDAWSIVLSYQGDLMCKVVNVQTLEELVKPQ